MADLLAFFPGLQRSTQKAAANAAKNPSLGEKRDGRTQIFHSTDLSPPLSQHIITSTHGQVPPDVTPITIYNSTQEYRIGNSIAVNDDYVVYAIKKGMIRVINQHSTSRCLLRGHTGLVSDMRFFSPNINLVLSVDSNGGLIVWTIEEHPSDTDGPRRPKPITAEALMRFSLPKGRFQLAVWHPLSQQRLAVVVGANAALLAFGVPNVPTFDPDQLRVSGGDMSSSGARVCKGHRAQINDLGFSPSGAEIITGSSDGTVRLWNASNAICIAQMSPFGNAVPVSTVRFLFPRKAAAEEAAQMWSAMKAPLLTGGDKNRCLKLWFPGWANNSLTRVCAHELVLKNCSMDSVSSEGPIELLAHTAGVGSDILLFLSPVLSPALYVLRITTGELGSKLSFRGIVELPLHEPVVSAALLINSDPPTAFGEEALRNLRFFCVQLNAIQCYHLPLQKCLGDSAGPGSMDVAISLPAAKMKSNCVAHSVTHSDEANVLDSSPNSSRDTLDVRRKRNVPKEMVGGVSDACVLRSGTLHITTGTSEPSCECMTGSAPGHETKEWSKTRQPSHSQSARSHTGGEVSGHCASVNVDDAITAHSRQGVSEEGRRSLMATKPRAGTHGSADAGPGPAVAEGNAAIALRAVSVNSRGMSKSPSPPHDKVELVSGAFPGSGPTDLAWTSSRISQSVASIVVPEIERVVNLSVEEFARLSSCRNGSPPDATVKEYGESLANISKKLNKLDKAFHQCQLSSTPTTVGPAQVGAFSKHIRNMVPTIGKGVAIAVSKTLQASLQRLFDKQRSDVAQILSDLQFSGHQRPAAEVEGSVEDGVQRAFERMFATKIVSSVEDTTRQMFTQLITAVTNGMSVISDHVCGASGAGEVPRMTVRHAEPRNGDYLPVAVCAIVFHCVSTTLYKINAHLPQNAKRVLFLITP